MLCDSIENFAKHDSAFMALRELAPLFEAVKTRSFEEMKKMELGPFPALLQRIRDQAGGGGAV